MSKVSGDMDVQNAYGRLVQACEVDDSSTEEQDFG